MADVFEETWFHAPLAALGEALELPKEEAHHLRHVLRVKPGRPIVITNGRGKVFLCGTADKAGRVEVTAEEVLASEPYRTWQVERRGEDPQAPLEPTLALYVPIQVEGSILGVLCLGPRERGEPYEEEHRLLVEHLCSQGALALDRAQLMAQNEDRVRDLSALLRISRELTSTLEVDRILLTAVNTTAARSLIPKLVWMNRVAAVLTRGVLVRSVCTSSRTIRYTRPSTESLLCTSASTGAAANSGRSARSIGMLTSENVATSCFLPSS